MSFILGKLLTLQYKYQRQFDNDQLISKDIRREPRNFKNS